MQNKLLISLVVSVAIVALLFYSVPAAAFYMSGTPSVSHTAGSPNMSVTVTLYKSDPLEIINTNNVTAALIYDPSGNSAYVTAANCSFGSMNYSNAYGYGYDFYGYGYGYGSTYATQFSGYNGYSYGFGNASGTSFACTFNFNAAHTLGHKMNGIAVNVAGYGILNQSFYTAPDVLNTLSFTEMDATNVTVNVTSFPTVNIANMANVTLAGGCKNDGTSVTVNVTNNVNASYIAVTAGACASSAWTVDMDFRTLPDSTLTATAYQTDSFGNTGTGTNTSTKDTVAPTCDLLTLASLSSKGYVNGTTLFYRGDEAGINAFTVLVNSTGTGGAVANVTFPAIGSGFSNISTLEVLSAPYNVSYTWGSATASGAQTATCYDAAGNSNTTSFTLTPASAPNATVSLAEPDSFYSAASGNNIINARVNVTSIAPITAVTLNFSNVTTLCGADPSVFNATYNATSGYWEGSCNVATTAATSNFVGSAVVVTTTDNVTYTNVSTYGGIVLYNMTTPVSSDPCMQFNTTESTNFATETNFSSINLKLSMMVNGSAACNNGAAAPWGDALKKVLFLNFTSVDLSTQAKAAKLQNLSSAMSATISPPKAYTNSRIYVNSTYFAELNTTTAINFYDLPFSSEPGVAVDADAAGLQVAPVWAQGAYDASYNTSIGNLTLVVKGFSGYNATDNVTPAVAINSPAAYQNISSATVTVNVTLNGTGTEISAANFRINGSVVGAYDNTTNTANCSASSPGSETYNCAFTTVLANGQHSLNVTAYDFGAPAPGNMGSAVVNFTVDTIAPVVTIQVPVANAVLANNSNTTLLNFTAASNGSGLNASTCQYSLNGTRVAIASCANGTQLNFTTDGVKTLSVFAKDNAGNEGNTTISFLVNTAGSNKTILNETTNVTTNEVIYVTATSPASNITMSSSATNVSLNLTMYNSTTFNVTLPEITVNASTSLGGNVIMHIPNGTVVSGSSDWNGTLQLPMVKSNSLFSPTAVSGYTNTVTSAIEIGVADYAVNLSKAVRILIPGKANNLVGFQRSGVFTAITTSCANDSQAAGDALATGADCKINNGTDMVIWTKHFTMFGTYTQAANGGGSGGSSSNGGGSVFGGGSTVIKPNVTTVNVDVGLGKTCAVAITRVMNSTNSLSVLTTTLENTGASDCSMTDFVFADTIPAEFPALNEVTFNPAYTSREGWTVAFGFPTFAAGESKTLTYSANQWVKTSLAKNFTAYTMVAKQQGAAQQPAANATTPTTTTEEPSVWIPRKLPPMPVEQPAAQPTAPAQPTPATGGLGMLGIVGIIAAIVIVGGVVYYLATHKKKGL